MTKINGKTGNISHAATAAGPATALQSTGLSRRLLLAGGVSMAATMTSGCAAAKWAVSEVADMLPELDGNAMAAPAVHRPEIDDAPVQDAKFVYNGTRKLRLYHAHTGESLSVTYYVNGKYYGDALEEVNHFLRDHHNGETARISARLLDYVHDLSRGVRNTKTITVLSAYRSPETNEKLRQSMEGVAKNSLHTKGQALDIRFSDRDLRAARMVALRLRRGGVGYYPRSKFLHLDVGPVRRW